MASPGSEKTRELLVEEVLDDFRELVKARGKIMASAWIDLQLTLPQFKMLVIISQAEFSTVGCIAEQLGIGEPTASYLVERLVKAGLVERAEDPLDRRKAKILVSSEGRTLLDKLTAPRNWLDELLAGIDVKDLTALAQGLGAVVTGLAQKKQRE